jgi:hypothetical protein
VLVGAHPSTVQLFDICGMLKIVSLEYQANEYAHAEISRKL